MTASVHSKYPGLAVGPPALTTQSSGRNKERLWFCLIMMENQIQIQSPVIPSRVISIGLWRGWRTRQLRKLTLLFHLSNTFKLSVVGLGMEAICNAACGIHFWQEITVLTTMATLSSVEPWLRWLGRAQGSHDIGQKVQPAPGASCLPRSPPELPHSQRNATLILALASGL